MKSDAVVWAVLVVALITMTVLVVLGAIEMRRHGWARPVHKWLWITCLVLLGVGTLLPVAISVSALIASGGSDTWLLPGALAKVLAAVLVVLQPRWGGWALIGSAIVVPTLVAIGHAAMGPASFQAIDAGVMYGFYSLPAVLVGALLVVSTYRWPPWARRATV